jgi:hypothetical protein
MLGKPVAEKLNLQSQPALPRVWWCMTGLLAFIPIHACSPKPSKHHKSRNEGMMDLAVSSYIPTLSTLLHAQKRHDHSSLHMLAVAMPEGRDGLPPLSWASSEVEVVEQQLMQL